MSTFCVLVFRVPPASLTLCLLPTKRPTLPSPGVLVSTATTNTCASSRPYSCVPLPPTPALLPRPLVECFLLPLPPSTDKTHSRPRHRFAARGRRLRERARCRRRRPPHIQRSPLFTCCLKHRSPIGPQQTFPRSLRRDMPLRLESCLTPPPPCYLPSSGVPSCSVDECGLTASLSSGRSFAARG